MDAIKIVKPIGCHLWTDKYLGQADLSPLRRVTEYIHDEHLIRALMECSQCGQKYYYEFYEEIDWEGGNDPQYRTYIPIEEDEQTIKNLNATPSFELLGLSPRLQSDWKSEQTERQDKLTWVGFDGNG